MAPSGPPTMQIVAGQAAGWGQAASGWAHQEGLGLGMARPRLWLEGAAESQEETFGCKRLQGFLERFSKASVKNVNFPRAV